MRPPAPRPWLRAVSLVALANAVFLLLGLWLAHQPREPLRQRIRTAFADGDLIENDWPWLDRRRGFDQYNDCSILQMITNDDDHALAAAVGPLIYNKNRGETDKCETLRHIVTEGPQAAPWLSFRYTRYWHGQDPVTAALLRLFDLGRARALLEAALYASLLLLPLAAGTGRRELLAVAGAIAVTGVLFWAVPYFGQSFTHAPGDILVVLGIVGLLFWRRRLAVPATLVPYSALYGAGAVYLEFLTGQLPTAAGLLLGSAYLIGRLRPAPDDRPRAAWRLALAALGGFIMGALLTVAIKQALAVAVVGPDALRSFAEYLGRYVNPSPGASLRHFGETWSSPGDPLLVSTPKAIYALLGEGYVLAYGSPAGALALYAASVLAWSAAVWLAFRRRAPEARSDLLALAAASGVWLVWACAFQTHTTIHKWWMVRMLLVPLSFGWGAVAWLVIRAAVATPQDIEGTGSGAAHPGPAGASLADD
jgi:hypothetical protein